MKKIKKYIIPLLTIIVVAFLLFGLSLLSNLIFSISSSFNFLSCLGTALGLYAIEIGVRPTEYGKKSDLQVLSVLALIIVIVIISLNLYMKSMELHKLILVCIVLPIATFVIYFAMSFYAQWNDKRSVSKKR
jgi:hypothetical protein